MKRTTSTQANEAEPRAKRFHNRIYRAELGRTPAGSPLVTLVPTNRGGRFAQHRQIAAFVYELAAEMERRSDELSARWVISPDVTSARIVIELTGDRESARASEFIGGILADYGLG